MQLPTILKKLFREESGATAVEYGLIAGLVAIACILALSALGTSLNDIFVYVNTFLH